jgi:hypothetical protein
LFGVRVLFLLTLSQLFVEVHVFEFLLVRRGEARAGRQDQLRVEVGLGVTDRHAKQFWEIQQFTLFGFENILFFYG